VEMSFKSASRAVYICPRDHQAFASVLLRGKLEKGGTEPLCRLDRRILKVIHTFVRDADQPLFAGRSIG
jgi:hypothetical protein